MGKDIRNRLREELSNVNSLGVVITRPDQILRIMRGISGSGKSTRAKELVGEGVIHSTDTLIEATGDYKGHFDRMIAADNWSAHSKMHNLNLKNSITSMKEGVSPVIIDNTNLAPNEPKGYVKAALEMGFADSNIVIEDVGTGGVTAEVLAERNSHGVPLESIIKMVDKHKGNGVLTVKKIMESKDRNSPQILYSAVVLDDNSKGKLLTALGGRIPEGWTTYTHHMTIVFGKGLPEDLKGDLGQKKFLRATELGVSDMAIAVKVDGYPTTNNIPHITIAANTAAGGKPYDSNRIENWVKLENYINLVGYVTEIKP